ncbi:MAG: type II toxin-antitoxin system Phd/YefM family antitoxin, partial [Acidobacteriaceae bacterium]
YPYLSILSNMDRIDCVRWQMRSFSATDAKQRLGEVLDAAQREPVLIRRQNRDIAILISPTDYERLRDGNATEFQRFCDHMGNQAAARGLTETLLNEMLSE